MDRYVQFIWGNVKIQNTKYKIMQKNVYKRSP